MQFQQRQGVDVNAKNRSMFPYRRGSGKKRGRGANAPAGNAAGGGGGGGGGRRQGGGGRRVANSAAELLPMLQPATKALAQMLAGNTKPSGQLAHARNVLAQAERFSDERAVDRLPPAVREEFVEQLARLKLTLADANDMEDQQELEDDAEPAPEHPGITSERLRELALSIAQKTTIAAEDSAAAQARIGAEFNTPLVDEEEQATETPAPVVKKRRENSNTLRLKGAAKSDQEEDDPVAG